jgi:hypothetical protein
VVVVLALVQFLRRSGLTRKEWLPPVALAALLVPTAVDHARRLEPGDSIHYYSYLHSALFDLDLQLANDYRLLGWAHPDMPNVLPVGAPILWSPLLVPLHLVRQAVRLFGAGAPDGSEPLYQGAVALATFLYGAAGLFLLYDTLKRWVSPAAAFWTTVLAWVGSPLRFYLSVLPGTAHGVEFFAAVLVLRTFLALRDHPSTRAAAWAGACCGLVFLTRSQDGLLLALPLFIVLRLGWRGDARRATHLGVAVLAGFVLAALPQLIVWQIQFGVPLLIPHTVLHGDQFLHPTEPQLVGTLISPRGGLFLSHPVLLAAALGLAALLFRDPAYVAAVVPVLLASWYLNASVFDWYHVRRFTGLVPLLAPGLAVVVGALSRAGTFVMALVCLFAWRYDLAVDRLRAVPGDPAPLARVLDETQNALAADVYRVLERPAPRAATALLAAFTGDPVLAEDVTRIDLAATPSVLRLPRPARNLSEASLEEGIPCRWVTDRDTRIFLPVSTSRAAILTVYARALETAEPQTVEMLWDENPIASQPMLPSWAEYRFHVPQELVHAGTNVLALRFARAPNYHRTRGTGPREMRPACLAWVSLHRD